MLRKVGLSAAIFAALLTGRAGAVTITSWDFSGNTGSEASEAATGSAANITGNALTRGAGLTGAAGANSINASGWVGPAADDYFEFGFTVDAGYEVDLADFYVGTRSSGTGPGTMGLYSSLDGFTTAITTYNQAPGGNFVNSVTDVSALTNLTGTVTFRLIPTNNVAANGGVTGANGTFRVTGYFVGGVFDRNMQFTGTVSLIPEPSSFVLLGLGGLGAALVAARRRKNVS